MLGRLLARLGIRSSDGSSGGVVNEPDSVDDSDALDDPDAADAPDDGSDAEDGLDGDEDAEEDPGFLRSRLDASVLQAHGASVSLEPVNTEARDQDEVVSEKEATVREHQQSLEDDH